MLFPKEAMNAAAQACAAASGQANDLWFVGHHVRAALIKETAPALYRLYDAIWRAGFTVNGMKPTDALYVS